MEWNRIIQADWASLPDNLLHLIAELLNTRVDILRLRAVCKSFRRSLPLPPEPISPYPDLKILHIDGLQLLLARSTVYAIQSLQDIPHTTDGAAATSTWFVKLRHSGSGKVKFQSMLSRTTPLRRCLKHRFSAEEELPRSMNLLDYRVMEVTTECQLETTPFGNVSKSIFARRVAASSCLDDMDDGFAIMMMLDQCKKLGVWRKGDEGLTFVDMVHDIGNDCFEDIVYHNGKFYAFLASEGVTVTVDPKSLNVSKVADPLKLWPEVSRRKRFVKSSKDLLLVCADNWAQLLPSSYNKQSEIMIRFHVFMLDEEKHAWIQVMDGLEDRVWFFGDCSFSVSAEEFLGCKGNCVYFIDATKVTKVIDLARKTIRKPGAFPAYFQILWPPPTWLKKDKESMICSEDSQKEEQVEKTKTSADPKIFNK